MPEINPQAPMHPTDHPLYQKAFRHYLRTGTPVEISIKTLMKASATHETPYYIWRTQGDDKVRSEHAANDGQTFSWESPPPTGNPGDAPGCRCYPEFIHVPFDPPIEPVYPELLLIALLRIPKLIQAWRASYIAGRASKEWRLADYKSVKKWTRQIEEGGWTPDKITKFIKRGTRYHAKNKTRNNSSATRYQIDEEFLVVDDTTKEVIQVSRPKPSGFKPNNPW